MLELLKILLTEFREKLEQTSASLQREFSFSSMHEKIKVAIGMRRVGKTTFIMQKIKSLINEEKVPLKRILYLNLEDDRLLPCTQDHLRDLIDSFFTLYPDNHDHLCYLFFDEIQNAEGWPVFIRRLFDTKKVQIFLTGSSSKLLSKEIHTSLRGRAIATEIWPYSFKEYLTAEKIHFSGDLLGKKNQDILYHHLKLYLEEGGFPETIRKSENDRREILQNYIDVVVMRDIIERHNISNITLIRYMIKALLKNVGCSFSINKFSNDIKSQGLSSGKNTLHDYLSYIEETYMAFSAPLYSESLRKTHTNPRKIYAIDTGLVKAYSFGTTQNIGHLFENLVFLDLKRMGHQVYYYLTDERYEVDFFTFDKLGKAKLYQVVWDSTDQETLMREQRALKAAEKELNIKGELITPQTYIESMWNKLK